MSEQDVYEKYRGQLPIRQASGSYSNSDPIVALLYRLMRDELATGIVEEKVQQILEAHEPGEKIHYTNGWLARYCQDIVERLSGTSN